MKEVKTLDKHKRVLVSANGAEQFQLVTNLVPPRLKRKYFKRYKQRNLNV